MKKYIAILSIFAAGFVFADYENYDGQDVSGKNFSKISHRYSSWIGVTAKGTTFSRWYGSETSYAFSNFTNANLSEADFLSADLLGTDFTNANLSGACLDEANVQDANFTDVNLSGASLQRVKNLTDTQLRSASDITKIYIDNVSKFNLSGLNMSGSYLHGANAEGADFSNVDLTDAELDNANLSGANFTRAVLSGTSTNGADFTNAIIQGADLSSMVSNGFIEAQLKSTASYKEGNLIGVMFDYNNISKWDLSNQNLQNSSFFATRITNVNFTNSDLRGAETTATSGTPIYKNTILADGVIKNFSMESADDNLTIRKYTPATSGGEMISAKVSESDATVSGGQRLS